MTNIGIIGCGYWGPNLLRNFIQLHSCNIKAVCELDDSRLNYIHTKHPSIHTTKDYFELLTDDDIDAIVIATAPSNHYCLAKEALEHGKHVLVEKPLALNVKDAQDLVNLAAEKDLILMVGHTFEFNNAVRRLKQEIQSGTVGQPYYFYAQRLNYGIVRKDLNALWSLAPHDISILIYLLDQMPVKVSARGYDFIQKGVEDVVFMVLTFPNDVVAHIQVSWLDPNKSRRMTVVGSDKMIVYDDVADNKLKIYDKGISKDNISDSLGAYDDFSKFQLLRAAGDVSMPKIDFAEPLKLECDHFLECVQNGCQPLTDGFNGLRVVRVLEAAQSSLDQNGQDIQVKFEYRNPKRETILNSE